MRTDASRLQDILEALEAIERRARVGRVAFDADEMLRVWCLHHLTIIGEAASGLSPAFRTQTPSLPWREIVGMRNAIVHGYFDVDWEEVWAVIERDLGPLKQALADILSRGNV